MLRAGLDLSRRRLDVCLLDEEGNQLDQLICARPTLAFQGTHQDGAGRLSLCAESESGKLRVGGGFSFSYFASV
jgi:hypothetical protein